MESNNTALDLQQFFPNDIQIQEIETTSDTVYIWMKSRTRSVTCPKCKKECKIYHAVHKRKVQDLPVWGGGEHFLCLVSMSLSVRIQIVAV